MADDCKWRSKAGRRLLRGSSSERREVLDKLLQVASVQVGRHVVHLYRNARFKELDNELWPPVTEIFQCQIITVCDHPLDFTLVKG